MQGDIILLLGVNHKKTPLEVREKLALTSGYEEPLEKLATIPGCKEFFLLSTCNRVELLVVADSSSDIEELITKFLFGDNVSPEEYAKYLYLYKNEEAIKHLFMVSASLDSMIVGESQILGQLKEAYRYASERDCTGAILNKLLHKSFSVAKRVRSETGIGSSAVSISYAAVELAKKIFGDIKNKSVLLVGAGEMAELAAEHLVSQGVGDVVVANRTLERAVSLSKRYNGKAVALEELMMQLENVDIVISSTGAKNIILNKADLAPIMRIRRHKPLFLIDIAVPRDLDPEINDLDNVYLYDIDDLNNVVELNKSARDKEAIKAKRIVEEESVKFTGWLGGRDVVPAIAELRKNADRICKDELSRTLGKIRGLSDKDKKAVEKMTAVIASKMLHHPTKFIKNGNNSFTNCTKVDVIRDVFGLGK